jgi:hypothetical protein
MLAQLGVFYGLYELFPVLRNLNPDVFTYSDYVELAMIIPVFIFQLINELLFDRVFSVLNRAMTDSEGHGLQFDFENSFSFKEMFYRLGYQLTVPIVFVLVHQLDESRCYHSSCFHAMLSYVLALSYFKIVDTIVTATLALVDRTRQSLLRLVTPPAEAEAAALEQ